jgi:amidohydrolase
LAAARDSLPGSVLFLFQPAEEGAPPGEEGGALLMLKEGAFEEPVPEVIFGLHAFPDLEVGQIGYLEGPAFAAADHFVATVRGRQSHGAQPHLSVDPVVMAAQVVEALQTIRSRSLPPLEPSVISVGIIRGGERFNIIPSEVRLEGTVRTYRPEAQATVESRMEEILAGITSAGGGSYELDYRHQVPATVNDRELAARMRPSLERVVGESGVIQVEPTLAGEDFAYFAERVPGFNFRLGVRAPGGESGGLHTPDFRADDGSIEVGVRVLSRLVWDFLHDDER